MHLIAICFMRTLCQHIRWCTSLRANQSSLDTVQDAHCSPSKHKFGCTLPTQLHLYTFTSTKSHRFLLRSFLCKQNFDQLFTPLSSNTLLRIKSNYICTALPKSKAGFRSTLIYFTSKTQTTHEATNLYTINPPLICTLTLLAAAQNFSNWTDICDGFNISQISNFAQSAHTFWLTHDAFEKHI